MAEWAGDEIVRNHGFEEFMSGFLSDGVRDGIAVAAFAVTIVQFAMALVSSRIEKRPSDRAPSTQRKPASSPALFRRIRAAFAEGTSKDGLTIRDLWMWTIIVVAAVPVVCLVSYVLQPYLENDKLNIFSVLIYMLAMVMPFAQGIVLIVLIAQGIEIIEIVWPRSARFLSGTTGTAIGAVINAGILLLSVSLMKDVNFSTWRSVVLFFYTFMALALSPILILGGLVHAGTELWKKLKEDD